MKMGYLPSEKKLVFFFLSNNQNSEVFVYFSLIRDSSGQGKKNYLAMLPQAVCTCVPIIHVDVLQSLSY